MSQFDSKTARINQYSTIYNEKGSLRVKYGQQGVLGHGNFVFENFYNFLTKFWTGNEINILEIVHE